MSNMCKAIIGGLFGVSLFSGTAMAACSVTYTFSNGTPADATQVNQNFSDLGSCTANLAPLANPVFTGSVLAGTSSQPMNAALFGYKATGQGGAFMTDVAYEESVSFINTATSGNNLLAAFYTDSASSLNLRGTIVFNRGSGVLEYNTTSDARLKDVLPDQGNYASAIKDMWIGDFEWKKDHSRGFGVLAQQIYPLFPTAVTKPADATGIWQVDYGKLAPLALWGVKDLYKATDRQNGQLTALNDRMKPLESEVAALKRTNDNQTAQIGQLQTQVSALQRKAEIQTARK